MVGSELFQDFSSFHKRKLYHNSVFSTFTAHTLVSGIFDTGSTAHIVSSFVGVSGKWKVNEATPSGQLRLILTFTLSFPSLI